MCVAIRSRNQRSCEITTAQPAKSSSASSSARSVSTSRSFVGSSSRSTLPPEREELREVDAVALAAREVADALLLVGAAEVEPRDVLARVHLALAELDRCRGRRRSPSRRCSSGSRSAARLVDVGELDRLAEPSSPASGCSSPAIMRNSVVLPAPFGPDHADDAAGRQRERQVLDEQPVAEALRDVVAPRRRRRRAAGRRGCGSRPGRASRSAPRRAASRRR